MVVCWMLPENDPAPIGIVDKFEVQFQREAQVG
jgi:hypothetical protein